VNKVDLVDGNMALIDDTRLRFGEKFQDVFFVSALRGDGIEELFAVVAEKCLETGPSEPALAGRTQHLQPDAEASSGCC
jgi:50S ribosomal subunit-associated GTPase HflX